MTLAPRALPAIRDAQDGAASFVPHLDLDAVQRLIDAASHASTGQRDALLIAALFDGCFRVSELLALRPRNLRSSAHGWSAQVVGKRGKLGEVALSSSLVAKLQAYAYQAELPKDARFFPVTRGRVHQIAQRAFEEAGLQKPDHVGAVHVLRHSGAIARLEATGNPKALQDHLRHVDARMTLRYLKTVSAKRSLEIQQEVDFKW